MTDSTDDLYAPLATTEMKTVDTLLEKIIVTIQAITLRAQAPDFRHPMAITAAILPLSTAVKTVRAMLRKLEDYEGSKTASLPATNTPKPPKALN